MSLPGAYEATPRALVFLGGPTEIADGYQPESLPSAQALTEQMCGLIERYPETAVSLKLLMHCFGDDLTPQASDTEIVDTDVPVVDLLLDGPLCEDPEAINTIGSYMYVRRRQQLEDVYRQITQHFSLPDLFSVLSILESPMSPEAIEKPDRYTLLSQQTSLLQRTIDRYGLEGARDINPSREHAAWHEFTRATRHLEDDPPLTVEVSGTHNGKDFLGRQLVAIASMRKPIIGLVNALGNLTGQNIITGAEEVILPPYTFNGLTIFQKNSTDQAGNILATEYEEVGVTVQGSNGKQAGMPLAMLCKAYAERSRYLDDETLFTIALLDALISSTGAEEFKTQFAAACVNLVSDEAVALHLKADETTLNQLFSESNALSSMAGLSSEADQFNDLETWPVRSSLEGQPDQMYVSNVDRRTFETRGTVDSRSERSVYGRMVCFDPGLSLDVNTERTGDSYDLELRMGLPRTVSNGTEQYICPQVPGFNLAGCYPADDNDDTDQYVLRYVATNEDPYEPREIAVLPERVERLSQRLENIGLSNAADQLRQTECLTLDAVCAVLEESLVYGNGRRKITLQTEDLEDLEFFVEDGCLVGVCSLFAALAVFSIQELLPESEPRVIGGHRLNPWTISADGHAQALFTVNGRQQITDLHARGQRDAQQDTENDSSGQQIVATTPIEAFGITAKNMFTRLHGVLMSKYRMPDEASLTKRLVKLPETNFARQLYSLVIQARSITGNATYDEISPLLQQRTQLADLLNHWQSTTPDTRRQLASTFGAWSDQEAAFFSDILKQLEQSLEMV